MKTKHRQPQHAPLLDFCSPDILTQVSPVAPAGSPRRLLFLLKPRYGFFSCLSRCTSPHLHCAIRALSLRAQLKLKPCKPLQSQVSCSI